MAFQTIDDVPSSEVLSARFPITQEHNIASHREQAENILSGRDKRLLMVVGPCSAFSPEAVYEYADRLARLQENLRERLFLIMRLVVTKPRTRRGWEGVMIQPDPTSERPDIRGGTIVAHEMMHRVGKQLPIADEMLNTENAAHFDGPLSYIWVGARTSTSPQHRKAGSGLESPLGIKNPTDGSIEKAVDAVYVAQSPNDILLGMRHIRTSGNPYAHIILRGSEREPHVNWDPASIAKADKLLSDSDNGIKNPAIVIDASHDNSRSYNGNGSEKDASLQPAVIESVMIHIRRRREAYRHVRGFMMESFLKGGKQSLKGKRTMGEIEHGLSITDACLSWEETEACLRKTADDLDVIW